MKISIYQPKIQIQLFVFQICNEFCKWLQIFVYRIKKNPPTIRHYSWGIRSIRSIRSLSTWTFVSFFLLAL